MPTINICNVHYLRMVVSHYYKVTVLSFMAVSQHLIDCNVPVFNANSAAILLMMF